MSEDVQGSGSGTAASGGWTAGAVTKSLLGYGVLAGPFYVAVVLIQALLRPGFNLNRDDASLLSNGSFGWVQIANFVLTGLMVICCALGVHRALRGGRGATRVALLVAWGRLAALSVHLYRGCAA